MLSPLARLRRDPFVLVFAVLPLVLGGAAVTAIASLVHGLLAKPFPWRDAERLVYVWEDDPVQPDRATSTAAFADWRRAARSFSDLAALQPLAFCLTGQPRPEAPFSRRVTAGYFDVFGVEPIVGRVFTAAEEEQGAAVVVLSRALWQRQFDADPAIVGRTVELDHEPHEVIGVIELESPREPAPVELWLPLNLPADGLDRQRRPIAVWGHLAPGVTPAAAEAELAAIATPADPPADRRPRVQLVADDLVGDFRTTLRELLAVSLVLLAFLAAHAAHLVAARRPAAETADRAPLLVAVLAGLIGVALSPLAWDLVAAAIPKRFGVPPVAHLGIDAPAALGVLAGVALVAAAATPLLKRAPWARVFAAAAVVLALVLVAGAVAATRDHLARGRTGIAAPDRVLTLRVGMRGADYDPPPARIALLAKVLDGLAGLGGVVEVGATDLIPLGVPKRGTPIRFEGGAPAAGDGGELAALPQVVTPAFFATLGLPLLEGRPFTAEDAAAAPPVAIVNRRFVADLLGGASPLGRRLAAGKEPSREIVGVVGDSRAYDDPPQPVPTLYLPHAQQPARTLTFFVRTSGDPGALGEPAQALVARLDRFLPVYGIRPLGELLREADWRSHLASSLLLVFAALGMILATSGALVAFRTSGTAGGKSRREP